MISDTLILTLNSISRISQDYFTERCTITFRIYFIIPPRCTQVNYINIHLTSVFLYDWDAVIDCLTLPFSLHMNKQYLFILIYTRNVMLHDENYSLRVSVWLMECQGTVRGAEPIGNALHVRTNVENNAKALFSSTHNWMTAANTITRM